MKDSRDIYIYTRKRCTPCLVKAVHTRAHVRGSNCITLRVLQNLRNRDSVTFYWALPYLCIALIIFVEFYRPSDESNSS